MHATAWISATRSPAAAPAIKPIHGLPVSHVTDAAANAPASRRPSSPILTTPERSEKRPPSAARTSGVASLMVDQISWVVKISLISLSSHDAQLLECVTEQRFRRHEQNYRGLQDLD